MWWTVGARPEGCTLPWTTLRHAVLFLISWHFCSSCLRLEPYIGIIQHSQCAISLNYICLVVAFTFHCEINCVSMAAPLDCIMACITVFPRLTTLSGAKVKKKVNASNGTFPLQLYFYSKVTISRYKHWEQCEMHYPITHKYNKNNPIWINSKYFYDSRCYSWSLETFISLHVMFLLVFAYIRWYDRNLLLILLIL